MIDASCQTALRSVVKQDLYNVQIIVDCWRHMTHINRSALAQVIAWCLAAPSLYLNQCWHIMCYPKIFDDNLPQPPNTVISLKITYLWFNSNPSRANELNELAVLMECIMFRMNMMTVYFEHVLAMVSLFLTWVFIIATSCLVWAPYVLLDTDSRFAIIAIFILISCLRNHQD